VFDYDAELRRYHRRLLEAVDLDPHALVIDVGCGAGQTTRAAAGTASRGQAVGIDVSAPMLTRARHLAHLEGLRNVRFECGDAQVHPLPEQHFTLGISRFGTMFFRNPAVAFVNIAHALRPGAEFTQLVWQHQSRQEWHGFITRTLAGEPDPPAKYTGAAAFSMADPARVDAILTGAGFTDVRLEEVREPVYYGADGESALHAVESLEMTERILDNLDEESAKRALDRLQVLLEARADGGVWFDSAAWLVTARRSNNSLGHHG
jgi:SAM-dependent methyltransferase